MRKASTQKVAPTNLGTKRSCSKCGTKFYDFGKSELSCPKCRHKLSPEELDSNRIFLEAKKKPEKPAPKLSADEEETTPVESGDGFESVDDLDSDDGSEDVGVEADDDDDEEDQY